MQVLADRSQGDEGLVHRQLRFFVVSAQVLDDLADGRYAAEVQTGQIVVGGLLEEREAEG